MRAEGSEDRDRDDLIKLHVAQPYKCEQSDPEHSSVECSERRHQLWYQLPWVASIYSTGSVMIDDQRPVQVIEIYICSTLQE